LCYNTIMDKIRYINFENRPFEVSQLPSPLQITCEEQLYGIRLLHAGMVRVCPEDNIDKRWIHRHPVYHIVLYTEESDFFTMNDKMHLASPGTLVVTSFHDSHCFAPSQHNTVTYAEIAFSVSNRISEFTGTMCELLQIIFKINFTERNIPIQLGKNAAIMLENNIGMLVNQYASSQPVQQTSGAITLLNILLYLGQNYFSPTISPGEQLAVLGPLEVARKHIELKLTHPLEIKQLARIAGLSPNYFNTAFRKEFGMPPIHYQLHLRMEKAKQLLTCTELRVQEIAEKLGFSDLYYFSNQFKRFTGKSPLKFRQEYRRCKDNCP